MSPEINLRHNNGSSYPPLPPSRPPSLPSPHLPPTSFSPLPPCHPTFLLAATGGHPLTTSLLEPQHNSLPGDESSSSSVPDDFPEGAESEVESDEPHSEDSPPPPPLPSYQSPQLSVKEKKELASYAHNLGKKLKTQQIGKSGVTPSLAVSFLETLEANELLKIKVHGNCPGELSDVVSQLENSTGSVAVGQIGRSVIIYRPSISQMKKREAKSARKSWTRNASESSDTPHSQGYRKGWGRKPPVSVTSFKFQKGEALSARKSWTRNAPDSSDTSQSQGYRKGWSRKSPVSVTSFKFQKKGTTSQGKHQALQD